jgi:hypothetical protein
MISRLRSFKTVSRFWTLDFDFHLPVAYICGDTDTLGGRAACCGSHRRYLYCTFVSQINTSAPGTMISVQAWLVRTTQHCYTRFNFRKPCDVICAGLSFLHRRENRSVVLSKDVDWGFLGRVQRRMLEAYDRWTHKMKNFAVLSLCKIFPMEVEFGMLEISCSMQDEIWEIHTFYLENVKVRGHLGELGVDGGMALVLKYMPMLNKYCVKMRTELNWLGR